MKVLRRGKVRRAKLYYLRDRRGKSARIAERTETAASRAEAAAKAAARQRGGQGVNLSPACRGRNFVEGKIMSEAVIAQKAPYGKELEAGKTYYWCACGRSANQPFCDGSHKAVGMAPRAFTAEKTANRLALRLQAVEERALLRRLAQEPVRQTGPPFAKAGGDPAGLLRFHKRAA